MSELTEWYWRCDQNLLDADQALKAAANWLSHSSATCWEIRVLLRDALAAPCGGKEGL